MSRLLMVARGALLCALVAGAACHHRGGAKVAPPAAPDSLRGIVSVTGASLEQRLVLRSGTLAVYLSVSPADSAALVRLSGAEVLARGRADGTMLHVVEFTVVRVDDAPALDGVLRNDGTGLVLETRQGRVTLGNPPPALRALVGARVWITGTAATGPNAYGVIVPITP